MNAAFGGLAWVVSCVCVCAMGACGSDPQNNDDAGSDATTPGKDGGATDGSPFGDGGGGVGDGSTEADPIVLEAGGPFLCGDCICGGADHLCQFVSGGAQQMPFAPDGGFGDAAACDTDSGQNGCTAIPAACLPTPTCECVLANIPLGPTCDCALDPGGSGLVVHCFLP